MFKKGDVYLTRDGGSFLKEAEIIDVCEGADAVLVDGIYGVQWMKANDFKVVAVGKFGHVERRGFWIFKRRVVIKE